MTALATSWKLAVSVQHGQVGKFEVLDLLDSAVLEHGQVGRGCRFATSCSGQICFTFKTVGTLCRLVWLGSIWPVRVLLVAFNLKAWSVGLWHVAANKLETCSMDRLQA